MNSEPKIYVASLCDYNSGLLHGVWIDANQEPDEIREEINKMLSESPAAAKYGDVAEEWAIHDYDNFHGMSLSEYESIERVSELAHLLAEHGSAFAAYAGYVGLDEVTEEGFQDKYLGTYESEEAFTEESFRESREIPSYLENFIDWEAMSRDWFTCGYYSIEESNKKVHIFSAC